MTNEVRVLVKADTRNAQQDIEKFSHSLGGGLASAAKVGVTAVAGIGVAAAGGLALSVNAAANFEHALDQVGAVANATKEEMKGLSDTALRIGKDTAFSASEAAGAMEMLAANGVSVADIMNGAADAAVALAAAGGTDLATAADTASTAMAVWGLKAADMNDVVNRLAGAANVSRFGVEDMSLAIASGGGAAKTAGVEFADFSAAIAAIAPSFSSGQDAGTSMKTFLANLVPDTNKAKDAFRDLGITTADGSNRFFDAAGNLKSMAEISGILHEATKNLSEEQKTQALSTMFGSDAMRAAAALAGLTEEEFSKLQTTMGNTDAADVAAQRMGNFKGSMEGLKGSLEVIQIEIGTKLLPVLTQLADWAAVNLPIAFAYIETEVAPKVRAAFEDIRAAVEQFVTTAKPHIIEFSAEVQRQFARFRGYYETDLKPAFDNIVTTVEYVVSKFTENWDKIEPVVKKVAELVKIHLENIGNFLQIIIDLLGGDWAGAWTNTKQLIKGVVEFWKTAVEGAVLGLVAIVAIARDVGEDIIEGLRDGASAFFHDHLWPWFVALPGELVSAIGNVSGLLTDIGKAIALSLLNGLKDGFNAVKDEVGSWGGKIKDLKGPIGHDRVLLEPEGIAIAEGLLAGLEKGWEVIPPYLQNLAGEIRENMGASIVDWVNSLGGDVRLALKSVFESIDWASYGVFIAEDGSIRPAWLRDGSTGPAGGFTDGRVTSSIPTVPGATSKDGTYGAYIGGGQYSAQPQQPTVGQQWNGMTWNGSAWIQGPSADTGSGGAQHNTITIVQNIGSVGSATEASMMMQDGAYALATRGL